MLPYTYWYWWVAYASSSTHMGRIYANESHLTTLSVMDLERGVYIPRKLPRGIKDFDGAARVKGR